MADAPEPVALRDTLSKTARDELLQRIRHDYEWAKEARDQRMADWSEYRHQYDSRWVKLTRLEDDEDLNNQYFYVPLTYSTIHRIECALRSHFLPPGDRRLGRVTGTVNDSAGAADIIDQVAAI